MVNGIPNFIKLLVIVISFSFFDGGRSFVLLCNVIHTQMDNDHINDVEVPHQLHNFNFNDMDKWFERPDLNLSCFSQNPLNHLQSHEAQLCEFSDSIWQPPETG
jgi:hypothetical protein